MRILIFDGAPQAAQDRIVAHGGARNGKLFTDALARHTAELEAVTVNVADGERLPQGLSVGDFDGVTVSGSPLNIYDRTPAVTRQLDLAREIFDAGVPVWGSCWGLQLMSTVLGGHVRLNPRGRELGFARNIARTDAGRGHWLLDGKALAFDALCSHIDEVDRIPDGARVLASNGRSEVQALEFERDGGSFVGVQYHPEHGFAHTAAIIDARRDVLVREGAARAEADLDPVLADMRALDADPGRTDAAWRLGLDEQVLDPALRTAEFGNWLRRHVAPRRSRRSAAT
ncbi:MAG: type 1 glutamine amidotransferase [Alphaproteobacteria bacterium]|nr:type 1 glutamine amidotransferase [Alphaproteobacteria bacterium]